MHQPAAAATPTGPARDTPLPGARTALVLLLVINLFNYIDRQVLAAVETEIERDERIFPPEQYPRDPATNLHLDRRVEATLGTLWSAFMFSYMLIAPLFGWLADRAGRWLLVGIGVIAWSLASGATGLAATFAVLFLTRCFVGIGEGAYGPVAPTVISDLYPVKQRGQKLAWFYVAIPVGSALGYVLGGLIVTLTGDWRWAFYLVVPPGILLGLWCFRMKDPPRGQADPGSVARTATVQDYLVILRTPSYVLVTLGMTAMTFAMGALAFFMPRYVVEDRGWGNKATVSLIFGVIVVVAGLGATIAGGLAGDKLRERYPGSYFLVSGLAMLVGFPFILLFLWVPFPWAWVFAFIAVFCLFFNTGPTNTILANVTHPSVRASAFALNIFVIHAFGDATSPFLVGWIRAMYSPQIGFLTVSVMFLVSALFWLWGTRFLERDTALAPTRLAPEGKA